VNAGDGSEPVTIVVTRTVAPGDRAKFERILHAVLDASAHAEGQLGATLLHEDGSDAYHVVSRFKDHESMKRWLDSPERLQLKADLDGLSRPSRYQQLTGLEGWFQLPRREVPTVKPPPRWKMWLASFIGAYPLVLAFQGLLGPIVDDWPLLLRSAALPLVLLSLMTYVMMPIVTHVLAHWLYPQSS
jgi:antibiotic biosynthesis monooxygenase (ABM) superfamily enzyme